MVFKRLKLILKPGLDVSKELKINLLGISDSFNTSREITKIEEKIISFIIRPKVEETKITWTQTKIPEVGPDIPFSLDDCIQIKGSYGSILIDEPGDKILYRNRVELEYYFYGVTRDQ